MKLGLTDQIFSTDIPITTAKIIKQLYLQVFKYKETFAKATISTGFGPTATVQEFFDELQDFVQKIVGGRG